MTSIIEKNQKWAKSKAGRKAIELVTGEGYNKEEMAEIGLISALNFARDVLNAKKIKLILKVYGK